MTERMSDERWEKLKRYRNSWTESVAREIIAELDRARARLESQRDAAFKMSKCECGSEEACRELAKLHSEIGRLRDALQRISQLEKLWIPGIFPNEARNLLLEARDISRGALNPHPTALWRDALEVMGYEVADNDGDLCAIVPRDGGWIWYVDLEDTWNLFGIAVEWIEARGWRTSMESDVTDSAFKFAVLIYDNENLCWQGTECAIWSNSYPTAAARWIVDKRDLFDKIAKEKADV
jgi:hypothetical protein